MILTRKSPSDQKLSMPGPRKHANSSQNSACFRRCVVAAAHTRANVSRNFRLVQRHVFDDFDSVSGQKAENTIQKSIKFPTDGQ